jgi:branched-chain amino acid transport system ATP-binding protein
VRYGSYLAVSGVSLEVGAGEVACLMGANGSGKSSVMNAISGLVRPAAGEIVFDGEPITGVPTHELLGRGFAHVLERRRLFPYMSVRENLLLGAYLPPLRRDRAARVEEALEIFPALRERLHQLAHTLSGGEQQMVSVARALVARPRFLMLDEPFLGLAPRLVAEIARVIGDLNRRGVTILFTEQAIRQSLAISHRGYVLESGRLALAGESAALLADERLHRIYMGLDAEPVPP